MDGAAVLKSRVANSASIRTSGRGAIHQNSETQRPYIRARTSSFSLLTAQPGGKARCKFISEEACVPAQRRLSLAATQEDPDHSAHVGMEPGTYRLVSILMLFENRRTKDHIPRVMRMCAEGISLLTMRDVKSLKCYAYAANLPYGARGNRAAHPNSLKILASRRGFEPLLPP